jgi:hypothetical protein
MPVEWSKLISSFLSSKKYVTPHPSNPNKDEIVPDWSFFRKYLSLAEPETYCFVLIFLISHPDEVMF